MNAKQIKEIRAEFYQNTRNKYNTTNEEIVKILKRAGYENFKAEQVPSYNALLEANFTDTQEAKREKIKVAAENAGKWREPRQVFPCPIPKCTGQKIFRYGGTENWDCSAGGHSHWLAMQVAKLMIGVRGLSPETIPQEAKMLLDGAEKSDDAKEKATL